MFIFYYRKQTEKTWNILKKSVGRLEKECERIGIYCNIPILNCIRFYNHASIMETDLHTHNMQFDTGTQRKKVFRMFKDGADVLLDN